MEQPLYRNELDPNNPFSGDSGAFTRNRENMGHAAGQIVLHETPHTGEISLSAQGRAQEGAAFRPVHLPRAAVTGSSAGAEQPARAADMSAWHNTNLESGTYGQAFHSERAKEGIVAPIANDVVSDPVATVTQDTVSISPVPDANQHYVAPPSATMANPLYGAIPTPGETTTTAKVMQPLEQNPTYAAASSSTNLYGAINPNVANAQPITPMEPRLPMGQPAPVDPQHRLPAPRSLAKRILQNPVVWLIVGIGMIVYFGSSLF